MVFLFWLLLWLLCIVELLIRMMDGSFGWVGVGSVIWVCVGLVVVVKVWVCVVGRVVRVSRVVM